MLICAIDTSGRNGSLALAAGQKPENAGVDLRILEMLSLAHGEYSAQLIPALAAAIERQSLGKSAIDLFVVASGPGSFTGLRVGLSTVKALAEALAKPIVAVSVLEAIAMTVKEAHRFVVALDAQRNEIFFGQYDAQHGTGQYRLKTEHEALATVEEFKSWHAGHAAPLPVFTADAAIGDKLRQAGIPVHIVARPDASAFARIGMLKFAAGLTTDPAMLDANYIRRSDAEILSGPKLGLK